MWRWSEATAPRQSRRFVVRTIFSLPRTLLSGPQLQNSAAETLPP